MDSNGFGLLRRQGDHKPQDIKTEVQLLDFLAVNWSGGGGGIQIKNDAMLIQSATYGIEAAAFDISDTC